MIETSFDNVREIARWSASTRDFRPTRSPHPHRQPISAMIDRNVGEIEVISGRTVTSSKFPRALPVAARHHLVLNDSWSGGLRLATEKQALMGIVITVDARFSDRGAPLTPPAPSADQPSNVERLVDYAVRLIAPSSTALCARLTGLEPCAVPPPIRAWSRIPFPLRSRVRRSGAFGLPEALLRPISGLPQPVPLPGVLSSPIDSYAARDGSVSPISVFTAMKSTLRSPTLIMVVDRNCRRIRLHQ